MARTSKGGLFQDIPADKKGKLFDEDLIKS